MKIDRHGQAKILTQAEIKQIFSALNSDRDRAIFGVCLFTACRIAEACSLLTKDVYDRRHQVRDELIIRKENTKGKLATRTIPIVSELRSILVAYQVSRTKYLFPGRKQGTHISQDHACLLLRSACESIGLEGASSHSFRRTALTLMSNNGIPLRVIQEISGHQSLEQLQKYLEVRSDQVRGAVNSLSVLAPIADDIDKYEFADITKYDKASI